MEEYRFTLSSDCDLELWIVGCCPCNSCILHRLENCCVISTDIFSVHYVHMLSGMLCNLVRLEGPIELLEHLVKRMNARTHLQWNIELDIRNHVLRSIVEHRRRTQTFVNDTREAELLSFDEPQPEKGKLSLRLVLEDEQDMQNFDRDTIVPIVLSHAAPEQFCAICLNTVDNYPFVNFVHVCQHSFHLPCIQHAIETKPECPVCKCPVKSSKKVHE